jgi:uncharacterized membrane protein
VKKSNLFQMLAVAILYTSITIFITIHFFYDSFQCYALDLGYFIQTLKYTLEGNLLYTTIGGLSSLAYHFSPITLLCLPFYWLFPYAQTLLVIQAVILGVSGCLIYILCRNNNLNHITAIIVEILFFLNPLIWGLATFDFHPVVFAIPFLLLLFIGIQKNNRILIIISLIAVLLTKEDVILTVAFWAVGMTAYYLYKERRFNKLYLIIFFSAVFAYCMGVVTSAITSNGDIPIILKYGTIRYTYLSLPFNEAVTGGFNTLFSSGSLYLILAYFAPFAFLPLLKIQWCFPALIVMLSGMLSTWHGQHNALYQTQAVAVPFLFISFILALEWLINNRKFKSLSESMNKRLPIYIFVILFLLSWNYLITTRISHMKTPSSHDSAIESVLELIPDGVSVTANNTIFAHICNRTDTYLHIADKNTVLADGVWGYPDKITEYIVIDKIHKQRYIGGAYWELLFIKDIEEKYELIIETDNISLYRLIT